jgi:hypothetical protein
MSTDYMMSEPAEFFAWMIFTTCLIGWIGGCLIVIADTFTEIRMALQGVSIEERLQRRGVLKKYIRSDDLE